MPFIQVNGCQIYYESLGVDQPGQPPVVLIHGSTQTGRSCWRLVALLLAETHRVIIPDCRGHGQSENPGHSYSFYEMASDTAALVQSLGYQHAHIIGHSNGGNVALVTLIEFPQVVQTAVLQAANAFVSPDLVEKEPVLFDPQRVDREAPEWRDEMIDLHGQTHGEEYWRELLQLTVREIISQPNYTSDDLARVTRPCLVIQGQNDPANAPGRHAQFIAENIPFAELWTPQETGHSVHEEHLFDWIRKVEDFYYRRGADANNALYRLKQTDYPDQRQTIFEVHATPTNTQAGGLVTLSGKVLTAEQNVAALKSIQGAVPISSEVVILLHQHTTNALVSWSVTNMRAGPGSQFECVSQALLGETVKVLESVADWSRVRLETDGYLGWIVNAALEQTSQAQAVDYRSHCNSVVQAEILTAYQDSAGKDDHLKRPKSCSKIPFGVRLWVLEWGNEWSKIRLPNGDCWQAPTAGLIKITDLLICNDSGKEHVLELIKRFIGVPYYWGGRTPFGYDCSGLAQAFYNYLGIQIPRDADQQFRAGRHVAESPQAGDLLFFGERDPDASSIRYDHISHVGISLGGDEIIHANSAAGGVSVNSLEASHPHFRPWLRDNLIGIRRWASE